MSAYAFQPDAALDQCQIQVVNSLDCVIAPTTHPVAFLPLFLPGLGEYFLFRRTAPEVPPHPHAWCPPGSAKRGGPGQQSYVICCGTPQAKRSISPPWGTLTCSEQQQHQCEDNPSVGRRLTHLSRRDNTLY